MKLPRRSVNGQLLKSRLDQPQSTPLWQFVHLKTPLFPHSAALEVIQKLGAAPGDDLKQLAKRLRKELTAHGVRMPHTAALDAVARIAGHKGWFDAAKKQEPPHRLTAYTVTNATINESPLAGLGQRQTPDGERLPTLAL